MKTLLRSSHGRISEDELRKTPIMFHSAASQVSAQLDNLSVLCMLHTVRQPAPHVRFGSADCFPKLANLCPRSHPKSKFWTKSKAHFWVRKMGPFLGLLVFILACFCCARQCNADGTRFRAQNIDPFLGPENGPISGPSKSNNFSVYPEKRANEVLNKRKQET